MNINFSLEGGSSQGMSAILEIRNLNKSFGGLSALSELDLTVNEGEILGLIGPNGAGKTTLFNIITGFYSPTSGKIRYRGQDITGHKIHDVAAKGIVRTFQLTILFPHFTTLQNILVATHLYSGLGFWRVLFSTNGYRQKEKQVFQRVLEVIDFMGLTDVKDELAKNLPHGYQRALGVAIAIVANPRLLLLDEPMTGMNLEETKNMMDIIVKMRHREITVLLVEHNMKAVMGICDRIVVLNFGRKIAEGSPEEVSKNEAVIQAYLGAQHA